MEDEEGPFEKMRLTGDFVTIKAGAGDNIETFTVHETIAKGGSTFFKAALDSRWKEGKSRQLELPEDEPAIVNRFLEWMYSGLIQWKQTKSLTVPERNDQYYELAKLYCFGEKIQDDNFCNTVMSTILRVVDSGSYNPIGRAVKTIYDGTCEDSPARKLMVHLHVTRGRKDWLTAERVDHHPEFLHDLTCGLFDAKPPSTAEKVYKDRKTWFKGD